MSSFWIRMEKVKPIYDFVDKLVMLLCKLLLVAEVIITTIVVSGRFLASHSPAWGEELTLTCMIYMAMLGATIALRKNAHIRMTSFDRYLPNKVVYVLDILADVVVLVFAIIMIKEGFAYSLSIGSKGTYISLPGLSKFWLYFPVPLAGIAMIFFEIEAVFNHLKQFFVKAGEEGEVE
ncbi:MAG: TRAP transporter small permease [Herbinix sp.]|nr:TRAP transporter small permease [Herbinix sp.]